MVHTDGSNNVMTAILIFASHDVWHVVCTHTIMVPASWYCAAYYGAAGCRTCSNLSCTSIKVRNVDK